ncbi:hypothetical protein [Aeromonas sp. QDB51]|uniref:hypothetical protein n=1 Tax=Aeromonas sp. QDB51 TaxID=2989827 RepID=UPI0022DF7377|nr:hypothetical protein [Aeromonas sp. QDB51]
MKKSIIALTILASLLTGCASDAEKMAQDQLALEQARRDGAAEARAQLTAQMEEEMAEVVPSWYLDPPKMDPRFYVSTSKSIIKALINMHSFEIQLSPIG